jgi:nicotinate-nucleotide adenylyltransferase
VKIAILGGTFDPIHNGHMALARAVVDTFDIDQFQFVPAFAPPHKPGKNITSPFHRFAMVTLAAMSEDRFLVSTIETDTLEPRYSVDTLELMHRDFPESSFLFITGTDMYQEIEDWKDYERLFELASLAVVCRPGFPMREDIRPFETLDVDSQAKLGANPGVYYLPWVRNDVSSTVVRETAASGGDTMKWVPHEVAAYIRRHQLYRT